jgi:hypothetical protein
MISLHLVDYHVRRSSAGRLYTYVAADRRKARLGARDDGMLGISGVFFLRRRTDAHGAGMPKMAVP